MNETHVPHPWISQRKNTGAKQRLTFNERLAVWITKMFGSMWMFYILIIWMFGWMFLATIGFGFFKQDAYPFTFLLFLSNLVQLFALPILAVGQQILGRAAEKQTTQTFKDAEALLELQDEVHQLIEINNKLTEEIHKIVTARSSKVS